MALRDQPYLPLYVQDYLTDEKLNMCSLSTQGVYIKIMCLLHKSDTYGGILLKQKDKQNSSTILNFASKFAKLLPISLLEITNAITELLDEKVLTIEGDFLFQKRMVKDNEISEKRSYSGRYGGLKTQSKHKKTGNNNAGNFAKAKIEANTEYENEYYIDNNTTVSISDKVKIKEEVNNKKKSAKKFEKPTLEEIAEYCRERNNSISPEAFFDFYESKGWKVGNQPMKDWKAAVRTWEKRSLKPTQQQPAPAKGVYESALEMNVKLNQLLETPGMFDENGMLIGAKWNKKAE